MGRLPLRLFLLAGLLLAQSLPAAAAPAAASLDRLVVGGDGLGADNDAVYRTVLDARQRCGPLGVIPAADDDCTSVMVRSAGLGLHSVALADLHILARARFGRLLVALLDVGQFNLAFGIDEKTARVVDIERRVR